MDEFFAGQIHFYRAKTSVTPLIESMVVMQLPVGCETLNVHDIAKNCNVGNLAS